jgi:hypothetical protein
MKFAERVLQPFAEPITADRMTVGQCYFSVTYADTEMTIPLIESMVFIGRDLNSGDTGKLYFQDVESYRDGKRLDDAVEGDGTKFFVCSPTECSAVFEFERAIEELMRCSLRRGGG